MSASSMPQVGPAMICASSSTRRPESGPGCLFMIRGGLASDKSRLLLREKRGIADAEILGVEGVEAFVVVGGPQRRGISESVCEALVPARGQWCTVNNALRRGPCFGCDLVVGDDTRNEPFLLRFLSVDDPAFEQKLQHDVRANAPNEWCHFRIGKRESQVLDRNAEAARCAADPEV